MGAGATRVEEAGADAAGAVPQIPALAFCLAISAIVSFCVGVLVFFGAAVPRSDAKTSPPVALAALGPGLLDEGVLLEAALVVDAELAEGTEVK